MAGKFAPQVVVDGVTVTPPGWMWIFAFAVNGCKWAIETASTKEFEQTVRNWFKEREKQRIESKIEFYLNEIEKLRKALVDKW